MNNVFTTTLKYFLNLGIETQENAINIIRIRIYNSLLVLIFALEFILFLSEAIQFDLLGIVILGALLSFTFSLLMLNKFNKTRTSIFIFNILYPILVLILVLTYQQPNNLEYIFFIFLISAFLLQIGIFEQILIAIIPFTLFIYSNSGHHLIGSLGRDINYVNDFIIQVLSILTVLLTLLSLARELRKYDHKINKLLIELERKNEELLDKNKELERFSYVVSHDMKTPLRAVAGYINIIEKNMKVTEENMRYFNYIKGNVTQLNNLVVQTLEFSKTDQEEIKMEVVNVNEILFKLSRDFITKDIHVYTEDFPNILGNDLMVNKLFQNIIENGGKYNNSKEKIIEIKHEKKGDKVIFSIKDNGIGIDEKFHEQIFEMYKRLHTKSEYKGTGLGLSICGKIAKRLQGDIYLTSKIGKGTTFYLELKLAPSLSD